MIIRNATKNTTIARDVRIANTFLSRLTGLLNRENLHEGEALVITRCQSIHMFFMRFPIDVLFVGKDNRVVGLVENIKPFQLSSVFFRSRYAVELKSGTIAATKTTVADQLEMEEKAVKEKF